MNRTLITLILLFVVFCMSLVMKNIGFAILGLMLLLVIPEKTNRIFTSITETVLVAISAIIMVIVLLIKITLTGSSLHNGRDLFYEEE